MENIKHSKKSMASYGCAKALNEFIDMAFTAFGFYYYESEIGLNVWLVSLGYIIFAIALGCLSMILLLPEASGDLVE